MFAEQNLNALEHTIHAHTYRPIHIDVHITYARRNGLPTVMKRPV